MHGIIYDELCAGKILAESKARALAIIRDLEKAGAQAVALACTELPLLISTGDTNVMLFDTMAIHARNAVKQALAE